MTVAAAREEKVIMNIIILSGGSGKRLWPLTGEQRPKQFIKCLKRDDGTDESMLQRVYRQIREIYPDERITIAANARQTETIKSQIGGDADISAEPCGRDTFAAIALAAAYLTDVRGCSPDDPVVVCPSDFYGDATFFLLLDNLAKEVASGRCDLALIGKEPESPKTEYGYIVPSGKEAIADISEFVEKPDEQRAKELIEKGAMWNCGVFAFRIGFVLNALREATGTCDYRLVLESFESLPKLSFDHAIAEKDSCRKRVVRYAGAWRDIGSWSSLTAIMDERIHGDVTIADDCNNVTAINELEIPMLLMGLTDVVVTATKDGILVSSVEKSGDIKKYRS